MAHGMLNSATGCRYLLAFKKLMRGEVQKATEIDN